MFLMNIHIFFLESSLWIWSIYIIWFTGIYGKSLCKLFLKCNIYLSYSSSRSCRKNSATANGCLSLLFGCARDRSPLSIFGKRTFDVDALLVEIHVVEMRMWCADSSSSSLSSSDEKSSSSSSNLSKRSRAMDRWCLSLWRRCIRFSRAWSRVQRLLFVLWLGMSASSFAAAPHGVVVEVLLHVVSHLEFRKESMLPTSVHAAVLVVADEATESVLMLMIWSFSIEGSGRDCRYRSSKEDAPLDDTADSELWLLAGRGRKFAIVCWRMVDGWLAKGDQLLVCGIACDLALCCLMMPDFRTSCFVWALCRSLHHLRLTAKSSY